MGKFYTTLLCLILAFSGIYAQSIKLEWATKNSGSGYTSAHDIAVDDSGYVYVVGYFNDTVDFDPGPDTFALISAGLADIFVQKLSPNGDLVWAKRMGGTGLDEAYAVAVDVAGNVYTTGAFTGTVDFNPGTATNNLTAAGTNVDVFVQKLTAAGNYAWANRMGSTNSDVGYDIALDAAGNAYITGGFIGTVDFNPGSGTANLISSGNLFHDIFIQKVTTNGTYVWAKRVGGTEFDVAYGIALDSAGNIYTTGYFSTAVDFDPGSGFDTLLASPSRDVFIHKLTNAGNHIWAKQLDGSLFTSMGKAIAVDAHENVYITGYYVSTVDFDPGIDTLFYTSAGGKDPFVVKLNALGDLAWASPIAGVNSNEGTSIAVDREGSVYTTGFFSNTVDFDPGIDVLELATLGGAWDIYVQKLDSTGQLVWARNIGNTGNERGEAITVDTLGNVYIAGAFSDTVDFDPQTNIFNLTSAGNYDVFVAKYSQCTVTFGTVDTTTCYTFTSSTGNIYTASGTYREALTNAAGCDSLITLNVTINDTARQTVTETACGSYTLNGETYDTSGTYLQVFSSALGCDSILTLELTIKNQPDATVTQVNDTLTATDTLALYQWLDCTDYSPIANATRATYIATASGDYALMVTANGCIDTSLCYSVIISGVNDAFGERFALYPNPTTGDVRIDLGANYPAITVSVSNIAGKTIGQRQYEHTNNVAFAIDAPAGMYLITITNAQGLKRVLKLVKE